MPDSDDAGFGPIVIRTADDSLQIIAEVIEVLPGRTGLIPWAVALLGCSL